MAMERIIRIIAGSFVLVSLALGYFATPWAYLFTAFVGLNLFQSGITKWCLMEDILAKFGVKRCRQSAAERLKTNQD
ncbi:MAG: DUF2892 domain-containing protein [Anaerolineaceae bacterium]|nr:DUF2892 domain-containing protein [Anaerolineaceae bacterium]